MLSLINPPGLGGAERRWSSAPVGRGVRPTDTARACAAARGNDCDHKTQRRAARRDWAGSRRSSATGGAIVAVERCRRTQVEVAGARRISMNRLTAINELRRMASAVTAINFDALGSKQIRQVPGPRDAQTTARLPSRRQGNCLPRRGLGALAQPDRVATPRASIERASTQPSDHPAGACCEICASARDDRCPACRRRVPRDRRRGRRCARSRGARLARPAS